MEESKQLTVQQDYSIYANTDNFELAQRASKSLAESTLLPKEYLKNIPNVMIALELANRIKMSPFMVMQNLYIVNGRPSWSSKFLIAVINNSGRFEPLQFKFEGEGDEYGCIAYTKDKKGMLLESPKVTWSMVKQEGWLGKNGSKWKTMPQVMFRYRAASFFSSFYCPEITMGMNTAEEAQDMGNNNNNQNNETKVIELDKISDLQIEEVKIEVKEANIPIQVETNKPEVKKVVPIKIELNKEEIVDTSTGEITTVKTVKTVKKDNTKQKQQDKTLSDYDDIAGQIERLKTLEELNKFKSDKYSTMTDANVFTIFEQNDLVKQLENKEREISF